MSLITPDFSEVKDNVGPGTYTTRVTGHKMGEWEGRNGNPSTKYVNWELETFNEEESKNNGRKIFYKTPINGKGAFKLQQFYKAAMKQDLSGGFDPEMLYSKELKVVVIDQVSKDGALTGYTDVKAVSPL